MSRKRDRWPGKIISVIFLIEVLAFMALLLYTKLIPGRYMAAVCCVLFLLLVVVMFMVRRFRHRFRFWCGTVLALLSTVVLGLGSRYIYQTVATLDNISGVNTEVAEIGIYVRSQDPAESLAAAASYTFGILAQLDRENTDRTLEQVQTEIGAPVATREYAGLADLADGLLNGDTGAVVLNKAYLDVLDQMQGYEEFDAQVREVNTRRVETVIERPAQEENTQESSRGNAGDVITLYISGIDTRGALTAKSLSDVNIIVTINTRTRQALLLSTPRDYFVPLSISGGVPDKLTHAGIYGINVCMDTLSMLYDISIDYYFRLNFAGFINIIDALGGITVYSDYEFDSQNVAGYHFNQGENFLNGEQALVFSRERYSFSEGDRQRGRNQMAVIQAVIRKALSPELLMNYASVLEGVEGSFEMNVPYDVIASLVRRQLTNGGNWNVVSYSVDGTGDSQKPYSMSQNAYVMIPDMSTVDHAKELMRQVRDGEILSQEE